MGGKLGERGQRGGLSPPLVPEGTPVGAEELQGGSKCCQLIAGGSNQFLGGLTTQPANLTPHSEGGL